MAQTSGPWDGQVLGDAGPYSSDDWADIWSRILQGDSNGSKILRFHNELEVSELVPGVSVSVANGAALVHGTAYYNTAAVTFPIAAPIVSTRKDLLVIRKTWATQTIVLALVAGVEGAAVATVTQNDGVVWEEALAEVWITIVPTIAVYDVRKYGPQIVVGRMGLSLGRTGAWVTPGSDTLVPRGKVSIQVGTVYWTGAAANSGNVNVVFPFAFRYPPMVFVTAFVVGVAIHYTVPILSNVITSGFNLAWESRSAAVTYTEAYWSYLAIGSMDGDIDT